MPQAPTAHLTGPDRLKGGSPSFTIVTAVYNVARYLPEFIDSIDAQTYPGDLIEVVAVDDGSTDESLEVLREWERRRPGQVKVLSKENGGQATARNLGLGSATGEWVTFTDPDDTLAPDYFEVVARFIAGNPETELVATKFVYNEETHQRLRDGHPLRWRFRGGDQLVDLDRFPNYFHGSAPAAFFKLQRIRELGLKFDERLRPNFEDGHFCVYYLLAGERPLVGFVGSAIYYYRRRGDQSSTLQSSLQHPGRYTNVPEFGYLDSLERASQTKGTVPEWIQNLIIYELSWFFSAEESASGAATAAQGEVGAQFIGILRRIAQMLDPDVVESFDIRKFDRRWRDILIHGLRDVPWHTPHVVMQQYDETRQQVRLAFRYIGEPPVAEYFVRGRAARVEATKTRALTYFGSALMHEQIAWVPANGTLRVMLNGRPAELRSSWRPRRITRRKPSEIRNQFIRDEAPAAAPRRLTLTERFVVRAARSLPARRIFGNAWVLIDRVHDADDNAERLFRYLRSKKRRTNAWFVVERGTPDWERLRRDGYRRVVAYDSLLWRILMLNCAHLISSHADAPVYRPAAITRLGKPAWKFTFLQHGVIKDDLSNWLNSKKIDLFVTSTNAEYNSIAGDGNGYVFTPREVKLTGLPRFDRLREVGAAYGPRDRNLILIVPTWRHWLNAPLQSGSQRRQVADGFYDSEFLTRWMAILHDPALKRLADDHGAKLAFLPHPNLQSAMAGMTLPEHVEGLQFHGSDVQDYFARAAVLVTDYSSIAFNAAYIDRPVVYYQFDRHRVLSGGHVGRAGYFDYYEHGFGPVLEDGDDVIKAVSEILDNGRQPLPMYADRIAGTFPERDGNCCKRVVAAIEALDR